MQSNAGKLSKVWMNQSNRISKNCDILNINFRHGMDSFSKTDPWNMERAQVGFHSDTLLSVLYKNETSWLREIRPIIRVCSFDVEPV